MRRTCRMLALWTSFALLPADFLRAQDSGTEIFQKAPPAVDAALRERVAKFFQAHVDGKFRAADEMVAEDSKDVFFAMEKTRYLSYELVGIKYSENFTKATVITALEMKARSARFGNMNVKPPLTSLWKFEKGDWYWYVIPRKEWETPFGVMKKGPDGVAGAPAAPPPSLLDAFKGVSVDQVLRQVKVSTQEIRLSSSEPGEGAVTVENNMPGPISLKLDQPSLKGLAASLDKTQLGSKESARVVIKYSPATKEAKTATVLNLEVSPTGQIIPLRITFAPPVDATTVKPKP
ncbi:MAG TPA: hypothetical protein VMZ52_08560 [Bryobacteraceae bacterium]|nr:hypothetical protein [Bryobacteraceae bacterium]